MKVRRHRAILCIVAALGGPLFLAAAEKPGEKPPPPKTHVLFMGADLSVQRDKKIYRVEDISGSELKIRIDRQEVLVPTRKGPVGLQVNAGLKLAATSVVLDQLKSGPAYTYENDPVRKLQEASSNSLAVAEAQDQAQTQLTRSAENLSAVQENAAHNTDQAAAARNVDNAQAQLMRSQQQANAVTGASYSDLNNLNAGIQRMQGAEGNFDAMEVSFKISSPVELSHPYMVILFKFHAPDAKPGVDGLVIHAESLDPIDATPRYVRVLKGGLPVGFKMVDCVVHIYNRGEEVATNRSEKRVELTRSEAQQYLVMEHLGAHKGATLPAAAVSGSLPREQRQALSPEELKRRLYVKVSQDGLLLTAYTDEGCTIPLDDARAAAALGEVFFTPALAQGKAVDGVVRVRLGDL